MIICGDHHAMVPQAAGAAKRFGRYGAAARVPLIVSHGNQEQQVVSGQYQQIDVFNGLKNLTSATHSHSDWVGDIFSHTPAEYIAHRRGDHRAMVSIFGQDEVYLIKLDGDDTRIVEGGSLDVERRTRLVDRVNAARIRRRSD